MLLLFCCILPRRRRRAEAAAAAAKVPPAESGLHTAAPFTDEQGVKHPAPVAQVGSRPTFASLTHPQSGWQAVTWCSIRLSYTAPHSVKTSHPQVIAEELSCASKQSKLPRVASL